MAAHRRDAAPDLTHEEVERLTDALKDEEFRKLLVEYCEEVQSPASRELYKKEFTELEKQRGFLVTFVNPEPGYVVKTSVGGDKKAFINVCSSQVVEKPTYARSAPEGLNWSLPYSLSPPHEDFDKSKNRCIIYDVVFHPNTLHIASKNSQFKKMLTDTAFEAVQSNHNVDLDRNNVKYPKTSYKGTVVPSVIRKPDPDYKADPVEENNLLDDLYPQINHTSNSTPQPIDKQTVKKSMESEFTTPKYVIIQRRDIEMKEFTYERDAKQHSAIPSALVVEVNLPLLSSTADVTLDVENKSFTLTSEAPAKYNLNIKLPYKVNDQAGSAKFDLSKRILTVTLPVIAEKILWYREDSGVESDLNSPCGSDEDNSASHSLITELSDSPGIEIISESEAYRTTPSIDDTFLNASLTYSVPTYTTSVYDNLLILTLDVKNVDPESIYMQELNDGNGVRLKFTSIGAGFFPIHHALFLKVPTGSKCAHPISEAWDNNVVLQIEITETELMDHFFVGLHENDLIKEDLKTTIINIKPDENGSFDKDVISTGSEDDLPSSSSKEFLKPDLYYHLPSYALNILDNMLAFTFHIKNVKSETFISKMFSNERGVQMKFSSLNSDETIRHYALCLEFPQGFTCTVPSLDAWDSNTIMRLEILNEMPDYFLVGLNENDLKKELLGIPTEDLHSTKKDNNNLHSSVEVMAKGKNEMNISLSRGEKDFLQPDESKIKFIPRKRNETFDNGISSSGGSFKGILKYRSHIGRSLSESNVDLMDYNLSPSYSLGSADCIPEESSSLKKTVRFSNVIAKQTFRTNSSILGQKSKNQRKKRNKKRAQERRVSEGDPDDLGSFEGVDNEEVFLKDEDDFKDIDLNPKNQRRDSGLADTDEGDSDKGESYKVNKGDKTYNDEKVSSHSPYKESKLGKYQEVNFKNDLIFDLDM